MAIVVCIMGGTGKEGANSVPGISGHCPALVCAPVDVVDCKLAIFMQKPLISQTLVAMPIFLELTTVDCRIEENGLVTTGLCFIQSNGEWCVLCSTVSRTHSTKHRK